ncbi:hypothetical protein Bca4012_009361 [Brassica carinata]
MAAVWERPAFRIEFCSSIYPLARRCGVRRGVWRAAVRVRFSPVLGGVLSQGLIRRSCLPVVEALLCGHGGTSLPSTGGCSSASPVDGFHTLMLRFCSGRVFPSSGPFSILQCKASPLFYTLRAFPAASLGLLEFRMWMWDWRLLWFVRFDPFGSPWFCVSGRTPCLCSGVGLLGTLFIQSKPLDSALSGVWSVPASSVETSLTLLSLG